MADRRCLLNRFVWVVALIWRVIAAPTQTVRATGVVANRRSDLDADKLTVTTEARGLRVVQTTCRCAWGVQAR